MKKEMALVCLGFVTLVVIMMVAAGCQSGPTPTPTPVYEPGVPMHVAFEDPATLCPNHEPLTKDNNRLADGVFLKYLSLFTRHPHYMSSRTGPLYDTSGEIVDDIVGVVISVSKIIDQSTLPEEDRIPSCIEGVPIQIVVGGKLKTISP